MFFGGFASFNTNPGAARRNLKASGGGGNPTFKQALSIDEALEKEANRKHIDNVSINIVDGNMTIYQNNIEILKLYDDSWTTGHNFLFVNLMQENEEVSFHSKRDHVDSKTEENVAPVVQTKEEILQLKLDLKDKELTEQKVLRQQTEKQSSLHYVSYMEAKK